MATWYIDQNGNDSNDGTAPDTGHAWRTLYKACNDPNVNAGDILHGNPGTISDVQQCQLPESVTIEGEGIDVTIFKMTYAGGYPCLKLESWHQWGNTAYGNQEIRYCTFDGDLTGLQGVGVNFRSKVVIHHCKFIDFDTRAVWFTGQPSYDWTLDNPYNDKPTGDYRFMPDSNGWCTGNKMYACIVTNCAKKVGTSAYHAVSLGTQDGFYFYGNDVDSTGRSYGNNGYGIGFFDLGFNKNSRIYSNTIKCGVLGDSPYEFAVEWWWSFGGDLIYDNRLRGAYDIVHAVDHYGVGYSIRMYGNNIGRDAIPTTQERGVLLEGKIEYVQIYKNYIHHVARPFYFPRNNYTTTDRAFHCHIDTNICVNLGQNGTNDQTWGLCFNPQDYVKDESEWQYFYVQHNIFVCDPSLTKTTYVGLQLPHVAEMSNIYYENNIVVGFDRAAIESNYTRNKAIDIYVRNNQLYNNGAEFLRDAAFIASSTVTYSGTLTTNPSFTVDYHLQAGSPCILSGYDTAVTTDYEYSPFHPTTPSRGAYEYNAIVSPPYVSPPVTPPGGPIYYVKNGGNDALDGLTDATAWATVAHANATISAGDTVLFKRGNTWREQMVPVSGTAGDHTIYGAYGTGVKPKFLGSVDASDPASWTNLGGNIWRTSSLTLPVDIGNIIFTNESTWGTKIMDSTPTLSAMRDFWYSFVDNWVTLYCTQNPATYWTMIELAEAKDALTSMTGKQYIEFQNLDWRYWGECVWSYGGNYIYFYDCDASFIGGADQNDDYSGRFGNGLQMWEGIHDVTIERCKISQCYDAAISPQGYAGTYDMYNLNIRHNLLSKSEYGFEFYTRQSSGSTHDVYFEHNTIRQAGGGFGHNQRPDGYNGSSIRCVVFSATKSNIFIRNNIFDTATERLLLIGSAADLTNVTLDYNCYYNPGGHLANMNSVNYDTIAAWRTACSQEVNGLGTDPLFVSSLDSHLTASSPVIGEGLTVAGVTEDYDLNLWLDPPAMGAYEYYAPVSPPYSPPSSPPYSPVFSPYSPPADPPVPGTSGTPFSCIIGAIKTLISHCTEGIYLRWWFNGWHYFNFTNRYEMSVKTDNAGIQVTNYFSIISKTERPTRIKTEYVYQVTLEGITVGNIEGFVGLLNSDKIEQYENALWREVDITRGDHLIKEDGTNGYIISFEITRKELPDGSTVYQKSQKLYLGDVLCDINDDEIIPINKQVNDIAEMQDRQSDFTAQFKIRKTRAMKSLFELSGEPGATTTFPYKKQICKLIQDNIELITNGIMILNNVDDLYYYVSILSGNINFFKAIENLKLSDLTLASTNHTWNAATVVASHGTVTPPFDYLYPLLEPSNDSGLAPLTDNGTRVDMYAGWIWPFIRMSKIWEEIFTNAGYYDSGAILTNERFLSMWMPISNLKVTDPSKYYYSMYWGGFVTPGINVLLGEGMGDFTGVVVVNGDANFKNGYYIAQFSGTYKITISIIGSYGIPPDLYIYKGGGLFTILTGTCSGLFCDMFNYQVSVTGVLAGETILIVCPTAMGWSYWTWGITEINNAIIGYGSLVEPRLYLPNMTQTDYIKLICNLFALIPEVSPKDHTIYFWNMSVLYDNIGIARDWSTYLSERDDDIEFKFGDYAQNNYLKYKESSDVKIDNGKGIMQINDETLQKEKDVVTLPVSTCDEVVILFNQTVSRIAFNKFDIKAIALAYYTANESIDPRIVYIKEAPIPKTMGVRDLVAGGTVTDVTAPLIASSLEVSFSHMVINYASLSRLLTKTNLRRAKFNLPVYEVAGLKHYVPIYLSQYKAYFYVNKINNYVAGQLCTVDLIKL